MSWRVAGPLTSALAGALVAAACSSPGAQPERLGVVEPTPTATPAPAPSPTPLPSPTPGPTPEPTPTPELSALFYYSRAVRLLEAGLWKEAASAFGLVIRRLPDFPEAYHGRGLAYLKEERTGLALEDFDRAIQLKPSFADAYRDRGILHKAAADTEKAVADLEKALSLYEQAREVSKAVAVKALLEELRR